MQFEPGKIISTKLNKRNLLKYLGVGALAGGSGLFVKQKAQAQGHTSGSPYVYMHGTSVQVEYTDRIASIYRRGFYTTIEGKPNTFNWFHFAIPTLAITGREKVKGGFVYFSTGSSNVAVKNLHLFVFTQRVAARDNLNLHGDNPQAYVPVNPPYPLYYGPVGITIGVNFGPESPRYINFIGAAGVFENLT
jgi:hypothetical protein